MILNRIKRGSTVLEFGCATGRMTRYMQQELDCRVYVVEFEEAAFQKAMAYAEDGLCDDIMTFRWREKFQDVRFDAVICADVLEHLTDPVAVLRSVAELLTDEGMIHISVPNITHNDVLVKAFRERFDYTRVGLLDDTHIHFWGMENLKELAEGCGMHLQSVDATYCRTGETEQKPLLNEVTARFENILRERIGGEVYQFVVALAKRPCEEPVLRFKEPTARMHLYLDTGSNFNQNEVLSFEAAYDGTGGYCAHYQLPQGHGASRIRFDPVEHQGCILTRLDICQNGEKLPMGFSESIHMEAGVCMLGTDPAVYADIGPEPVELDVRMVLSGAEYERILQAHYCGKKQEAETLQQEIMRQQALAQAARRQSEAAIEKQEARFAAAQKEIRILEAQLEQIRTDLCGYIILSNNKEKYILELEQRKQELERNKQELEQRKWELEQNKQELEQRKQELEQQNLALEQHNQQLDQMLRYRNTLKGLLRGLAGWTVRKIKALARKILRRRSING